ncbi:hypothetical protein KCU73_g11, partial [Aureobasidium melanogenum]
MAPWWPSSSGPDKPERDDDPFADFRRFADEQINALVEGVNSLPGFSSASLAAEEQRWSDEMRELRRRLEQDFPPLFASLLGAPERRSYLGGPISEEARQAARVLLLQARNASFGVDPRKILSLYQDHGQATPLGLVSTGSDIAHTLPSNSNNTLLLTNMETLYNHWALPGIDWMLGLQCRGILPPQLPSLYNITPLETKKLDRVFGKIVSGVSNFWTPYGRAVYEDFTQLARIVVSPDVEDLVVRSKMQPDTELDMYERLWMAKEDYGKDETEASKSTATSNNDLSAPPPKNEEAEKPSVIAVMTTTEMRTMPDGTVYTKRVLKKRFSDGTEENREEESTGPPDSDDKSGSGDDGHAIQDKKGGWFWH